MKKILKYILLLLVLYYFGAYLYENWSKIDAIRYDTDWVYLSASVLSLLSVLFLLAVSLKNVVSLFHYDIPLKKICIILFYSQFAKYLPGGIWGYVGRVFLYKKEGMQALDASKSVLLETLLMLLTGIFVALVSLCYFENDLLSRTIGSKAVRGAGIFLLIGLIVIMHPKILNRIMGFVPERFRKKGLHFDYHYHHLLKPTLFLTIFWLGVGAGFWLLIKSFFPIEIILLPVVTGAFILSWIAGILIFFTPGGLGVREVSMVVLLNICVPVYISAFIAVASRVWWIAGESIGFLFSYLWNRVGDNRVSILSGE